MQDLKSSQFNILASSIKAVENSVTILGGSVKVLESSVKELAKQMKEGFSSMKEYVDRRFDQQEELNFDQFKKVHQRIDLLEKNTAERFDETDRKFEEKLDDRIDGVKSYLGAKIDKLDERVSAQEARDAKLVKELGHLDRVDEKTNFRVTRLEMKVGIIPALEVYEPAEA